MNNNCNSGRRTSVKEAAELAIKNRPSQCVIDMQFNEILEVWGKLSPSIVQGMLQTLAGEEDLHATD